MHRDHEETDRLREDSSQRTAGKLTLPDRVLFRGHLKLRDPRTLGMFLARSRVLLKDFGAYAEARTAELKAHAERLAAEAGRPFLYLSSPHTARTGYSNERTSRLIAKLRGHGLIAKVTRSRLW